MSKGKLVCTLLWREIEGEANISLSQTNKVKFIWTLPWREIEGKANENENDVLKIMRLFSSTYKNEKEKATTENARLSPFVGMRRLERPTPTSRT